MIDLARVAKLHEAAIAAGLPGVLPDGYEVRRCSIANAEARQLISPVAPFGWAVHDVAAQAAVAWWLREWCIEHRGVDAFGDPEVRTDIEYLEWAEEIVANRKANP